MISSEPNDVFFERAGITFVLRVAGLAVNGDRILLHRSVLDDFWSLPGGRINIGETTESALIREMLEETDVEVGVSRLLWTVENFFEYRGVSFHELGLYYLVTLPPEHRLQGDGVFHGSETGGVKLEFRWFDPRELARVEIKPSFLRSDLRSIPNNPVHIVHSDV